jgi:dihydroorotase
MEFDGAKMEQLVWKAFGALMTVLPLETVIDKCTGKTTFGIAIEPINEGSNTLFNPEPKVLLQKHLFYQIKKLRVLGSERKYMGLSIKVNFSIENE